MDSGRPPPPSTTPTADSTTTELFFCFTSRLHSSSSSMKISSKSILSPGRAGTGRDPPISLSTSLSRRLRTSRSIKGGASPAMFPAAGKRRGCGFDNPEPSSPKVTCIGQVRVKSKKKHAKNLRTLSRRHSTGDVSFRKLEHSRDGFGGQSQHQNQEVLPGQRNNNQRWVHLPLTICEALREFSCLFPCRSSCFSTTEKEEKTAAGNRQGSCSAVFARWLVALQDGDEAGRRAGEREIELVAGEDEDEDEEEEMGVVNSRRHVFEDLEIVNDCIQGGKDEARVSICVPPKNALLLMRCRSDPMKMEALTNRFWEPSVGKNEEEDEELVDEEDEIEEKSALEEDLQQKVMALDEVHGQEHDDSHEVAIDQEEVEMNLEMEMKQSIKEEEEENQEKTIELSNEEEEDDQEKTIELSIEEEEEESMYLGSLFEENADEIDAVDSDTEDAIEELFEEEIEEKKEEEMVTEFTERSETHEKVVMESEEVENGVLERESEVKEEEEEEEEEKESSSRALPECLLLMMYEPKLSMEVSKETWVCSTDFIRRHSSRKKPPPPPLPPVKPIADQAEPNHSTTNCITIGNHVTIAATAAAQHQPARSSCSLLAPPSMAAMLEQKLVNAVGYEPFVLTRCKSEPMRTAAAKLVPETCFWKNRKLEPLRRTAFGIGVAGLGF